MPYKDKEARAAYNKDYQLNNKAPIRERRKQWEKANQDNRRTYAREYKRNNKSRCRGYDLKRLYDISPGDYDRMLLDQNDSCAICKKHQREFKRALEIDHNHTTEKVRGLLCHCCNTAIGLLKEDDSILQSAIDYVKKWKQ